MIRPELLEVYRRHPARAADARRRQQLLADAARACGELDQAVHHWDRVDAFNTLLDELERCRLCGRPLSHPVSVARHIGPECWDKNEKEVMSTPDTATTQRLGADFGEVVGAQTGPAGGRR